MKNCETCKYWLLYEVGRYCANPDSRWHGDLTGRNVECEHWKAGCCDTCRYSEPDEHDDRYCVNDKSEHLANYVGSRCGCGLWGSKDE